MSQQAKSPVSTGGGSIKIRDVFADKDPEKFDPPKYAKLSKIELAIWNDSIRNNRFVGPEDYFKAIQYVRGLAIFYSKKNDPPSEKQIKELNAIGDSLGDNALARLKLTPKRNMTKAERAAYRAEQAAKGEEEQEGSDGEQKSPLDNYR